ncbi:tryptophan synthase subunit alpha [Lewinellaceae bacterium SD302]|nr:tryptophan synthase subunit alpha [Lewinellaceae bacterium SD302]
MNRLDHLFANKQADVLNVYFTAGYPELNDTVTIIRELADAGADLIEIGMPFSDPMADGETIQQSSMKALENGMTLDLLFEQIREARKHTQVPLVLMGYLNQLIQYGEQRFLDACAETGVDGLILPDLPVYEFEQHYKSMIEAAGLRTTFLITPNTSETRIRQIADLSDGFIYVVSSSSITGKSGKITPEQIAYFERINTLGLSNPRLIGFGISDSESFNTACQYANGAIIGSAFIRALGGGGEVGEICRTFVDKIKA